MQARLFFHHFHTRLSPLDLEGKAAPGNGFRPPPYHLEAWLRMLMRPEGPRHQPHLRATLIEVGECLPSVS